MPARAGDPFIEKRTSRSSEAEHPAATGCEALAERSQASFTAPPLRSAPVEAAVAEVFGTLSVRVGMMRTRLARHAESRIATCSIFVCRPWPISVPPWFTCTVPSR